MRTKPNHRRGRLCWLARLLSATRSGYGRVVGFLVRVPVIPLAVLAVASPGAVMLFTRLPSTFLPAADHGALFLDIQLPHAASLDRTQPLMAATQEPLSAPEVIESVVSLADFSP